MKDFDKYYDLLENNSTSELNQADMKKLEDELGNLSAFEALENTIQKELENDNPKPSAQVKSKLDLAFNKRHSGESKQHGIISIKAFERSNPWKMMATAASMTIVLFLSVQVGFDNNHQSISSPYIADSNYSVPIDSGTVSIDSVVLID